MFIKILSSEFGGHSLVSENPMANFVEFELVFREYLGLINEAIEFPLRTVCPPQETGQRLNSN